MANVSMVTVMTEAMTMTKRRVTVMMEMNWRVMNEVGDGC